MIMKERSFRHAEMHTQRHEPNICSQKEQYASRVAAMALQVHSVVSVVKVCRFEGKCITGERHSREGVKW
jgi:hypothetical protein